MTPNAARRELQRCAGKQFDPQVVRAFFGISVRRLWWTVGPTSWVAQIPFILGIGRSGGQAVTLARAASTVAINGLAGLVTLGVAIALPTTSAPPSGRAAVVASAEGTTFQNPGPESSGSGEDDVDDEADDGDRDDGTIADDPAAEDDGDLDAPPGETPADEGSLDEPTVGDDDSGEDTATEPTEDPAGEDPDSDDVEDGTVDGITDTIDDTVEVVEDVVDETVEVIEDVVDDTVDTVVGTVTDTVDDVTDTVDDVVDDILGGLG
jgi:hypothetical protein